MNKKEIQEKLDRLEVLEERKRKEYARHDKHMKAHYHRQTVNIRNEIYDMIKQKYGEDVSVNGYIVRLIKADLGIE